MMPSSIILIVDDDADDRFLFREALREIDISLLCLESENGKEAMEMLCAQDALLPDFIFIDLNMPLLNGFQCLSEIKKRKNLCHIPVIIYTTSGNEADMEMAKRMGAAHFITKPFSLSEICQQIEYVLSLGWEATPVSVAASKAEALRGQ